MRMHIHLPLHLSFFQAKDIIPNLQDPDVAGEEILGQGVWQQSKKVLESGEIEVTSEWRQTGFGDGEGWETGRFHLKDVLAGWFQCVSLFFSLSLPPAPFRPLRYWRNRVAHCQGAAGQYRECDERLRDLLWLWRILKRRRCENAMSFSLSRRFKSSQRHASTPDSLASRYCPILIASGPFPPSIFVARILSLLRGSTDVRAFHTS